MKNVVGQAADEF
jgi:hypothetical protein